MEEYVLLEVIHSDDHKIYKFYSVKEREEEREGERKKKGGRGGIHC